MKRTLFAMIIFGLSACATGPKTDSEFLTSLPDSVRSDVCTNQEYLSCMKLTKAQCLSTAESVGQECQKNAKTKMEKDPDQYGALGAFHGCVAFKHLMQTKQKDMDTAMACGTMLFRAP